MGGTPISSYEVAYKKSTDATYTTAGSTTSTTLQFTQSVSSPGATYEFIVYAVNAAGTSAASSVLSVIAADQPSVMSAPFLIYADTTQIQIGWTAPSSTGYSNLQGYLVYWNGGGSGQILSTPIYDTQSPSILTFTTTAVTAGTKYSFTVAAYNLVSTSSQSNIV